MPFIRRRGPITHQNYSVKFESIYLFTVNETLIGNVGVKTKIVHFYVQRNTSFSTNSIIPFELERLNVGGAIDLATGVFTAPVDGIYHFEFSGVNKHKSANYFYVFLQLNGDNVGFAMTHQFTGSYDSVSLTASFRQKLKTLSKHV